MQVMVWLGQLAELQLVTLEDIENLSVLEIDPDFSILSSPGWLGPEWPFSVSMVSKSSR